MENFIWKISHLIPYLDETVDTDRIYIHQCLASTNDTAKVMAKEDCPHGTVVIADKQTAGRGRFNRNFYSPEGTGLYMSVILDADKLCLDEFTLLTPLVAVIASRVIHNCTGKKCGIKWVNDLYLGDKKICGILTEGVMIGNSISKIVVGIGINIATSEFPEEISGIAGALVSEDDEIVVDGLEVNLEQGKKISNFELKSNLAASLINELVKEQAFKDASDIMEEYREKQILIDKTVTVFDAKESYVARVLGVDCNGCLQVERVDGELAGQIEILNSGEVSLKRI